MSLMWGYGLRCRGLLGGTSRVSSRVCSTLARDPQGSDWERDSLSYPTRDHFYNIRGAQETGARDVMSVACVWTVVYERRRVRAFKRRHVSVVARSNAVP